MRLPFGGHLLKRFPEGGYSNEKQYYYPWAVAPEQEVLYQMERFESRAENEEQVLSAVYRRYKEESTDGGAWRTEAGADLKSPEFFHGSGRSRRAFLLRWS